MFPLSSYSSRLLSRLTLLFLVVSPTTQAGGAVEENRSSLHTYTPSPSRSEPSNGESSLHCRDCWSLKPDDPSRCPGMMRNGIDASTTSAARVRTSFH